MLEFKGIIVRFLHFQDKKMGRTFYQYSTRRNSLEYSIRDNYILIMKNTLANYKQKHLKKCLLFFFFFFLRERDRDRDRARAGRGREGDTDSEADSRL